jgi:hypothetical protein
MPKRESAAHGSDEPSGCSGSLFPRLFGRIAGQSCPNRTRIYRGITSDFLHPKSCHAHLSHGDGFHSSSIGAARNVLATLVQSWPQSRGRNLPGQVDGPESLCGSFRNDLPAVNLAMSQIGSHLGIFPSRKRRMSSIIFRAKLRPS